jgi:hypothetical protein
MKGKLQIEGEKFWIGKQEIGEGAVLRASYWSMGRVVIRRGKRLMFNGRPLGNALGEVFEVMHADGPSGPTSGRLQWGGK